MKSPKHEEKRTRKRKLEFLTEDKTVWTWLTPKQSTWYILYISNGDDMDETELKDFCNQFRVPYENFKELLQELNDDPLFSKWAKGTTDCYRQPSSPLSMVLLEALRYLGRGDTFDDWQASSFIYKETHHHFFHVFLKYGSSIIYDRFIVMPTAAEEAKTHMHEMKMAGFPGCISSTDATHITTDRCPYKYRQLRVV